LDFRAIVPAAMHTRFDSAAARRQPARMPASPLHLRRARAEDSPACLALVTQVLAEFGLQPDVQDTDADLSDLDTASFSRGGDFAVLVDESGAIVGTCGLFPLEPGVVELRKMYLSPHARGRGEGHRLLDWALTRARELGFRRMTLETATVLKDAIALYERNGFARTCGGAHSCRCDLAYARDL
jgi:GNAT superfamily N-acetyltransferase